MFSGSYFGGSFFGRAYFGDVIALILRELSGAGATPNAIGKVLLVDGGYRPARMWNGNELVAGSVSFVADENGNFSVSLMPTDNASNTVYYEVRLKGAGGFRVIAPLPSGTGAYDFETFRDSALFATSAMK